MSHPYEGRGEVAQRVAPGIAASDLSRVPVNLRQPLEDLDQAYRLAVMLSQSNLVPVQLRNSPQNTLIVIMTGLELGLTVTQALRTVFVTKGGMPGLRGEMLLGKLRQAGHDYDYTEPTIDGCVFRLHRGHPAPFDGEITAPCGKGRDYFGRFTIDDAEKARLIKRAESGDLVARSQNNEPMPWELYGPDMMFWRAASRAIKRGAPEITLGFSIAEAVDEEEPPGPKLPVPAGTAVPALAVPSDDAAAELRRLERDMTPAAGGDTLAGPGRAAGDHTGPDAGPEEMPPGSRGHVAGPGSADRTQADPRAAGAASARGAQPPPPQDPTRARSGARARVAVTASGYQDTGAEMSPAGPIERMPDEEPQPSLMGEQMFLADDGLPPYMGMSMPEPLIDPDCKAGKHSSCVGGPCECRDGTHVTGHGLPVSDPTPAPSAGTPKAATSRGSSSARLAESPWYDVADMFDQLGWPLKPYHSTVMDAIGQYVRRRIRKIEELSEAEAGAVYDRLVVLKGRHEAEHYPVALADEVEKWREDWRTADPDGYDEAHSSP